MDFLTGMAYWGILVLVVANAILVSFMKVSVRDDAEPPADGQEDGAP